VNFLKGTPPHVYNGSTAEEWKRRHPRNSMRQLPNSPLSLQDTFPGRCLETKNEFQGQPGSNPTNNPLDFHHLVPLLHIVLAEVKLGSRHNVACLLGRIFQIGPCRAKLILFLGYGLYNPLYARLYNYRNGFSWPTPSSGIWIRP